MDCYLCAKYPCVKSEGLHEKAKELNIRVTLNGCEKYIGESMKKSSCEGCEDNYYNQENQSCPQLHTAKLVWRKMVRIDQNPPYTQKPIIIPSCYRVMRYVFVNADRTC